MDDHLTYVPGTCLEMGREVDSPSVYIDVSSRCKANVIVSRINMAEIKASVYKEVICRYFK